MEILKHGGLYSQGHVQCRCRCGACSGIHEWCYCADYFYSDRTQKSFTQCRLVLRPYSGRRGKRRGAPFATAANLGYTAKARLEGYLVFWKQIIAKFSMQPASTIVKERLCIRNINRISPASPDCTATVAAIRRF
jgi:hypothetical protein